MIHPNYSCPGYPLLHEKAPPNFALLSDSVVQRFRESITGINCLCSVTSGLSWENSTVKEAGWLGSAGTVDQSA